MMQMIAKIAGWSAVAQWTSCGPLTDETGSILREDENDIIVKDIQTHVRGSRGFRGSILKAKDIAAGKSVTLYVDEGSHKHGFEVGPEEYAKLIRGEKVQMVTERASGHTHTMVIDPSYNPRNAESARISRNPNPLPNREKQLKIAVSGDQNPSVFMKANGEVGSGSAAYCTGNAQECADTSNNWSPLQVITTNGQETFRLPPEVNIQPGTTVAFRANVNASLQKRVVQFLKGQ